MSNTARKLDTADHRQHSRQVDELHSVFLELDRLKTVRRRNPIYSGKRTETTAEHSWHLSVAVILFARFAAEEIDVNRAVSLAVVHDIPEVFVGDTFVYSAEVESRHNREMTAMLAFAGRNNRLPEVTSIMEQWIDYESCQSPEGRFVMALDVLLPVFLNHANPSRSSWTRHGISGHQVRTRISGVQQSCPELANLALHLVNEAVSQGVLKSGE